MVKMKTIYYKDREFNSIKELAEFTGVPTSTLNSRLTDGWSLEEAIETKTEEVRVHNNEDLAERAGRLKAKLLRKWGLDEIEWEDELCYKGVKYRSIDELAYNMSIDYTTIVSRLKQGWNLKEAIEKPVYRVGKAGKRVEYRGVEYRSFKDLADAYGINQAALRYRVDNGWKLEDALTNTIKNNFTEVEYKGVMYKSIADLAQEIGISKYMLRYRLRLGETIDEAIEKIVSRGSIEYNGKIYESRDKLAKEHNISIDTLNSRLKNGWSLEEAVTLKPRERRKNTEKKKTGIKKGNVTEYNGKRYNSNVELAKEHNMSVQVLASRISKGMSVEEAVSKPVRKKKNSK